MRSMRRRVRRWASAAGASRVDQLGGQVSRQARAVIHLAQQGSGVGGDVGIGLTQLDGSVKRRLI